MFSSEISLTWSQENGVYSRTNLKALIRLVKAANDAKVMRLSGTPVA